MLAKKPWAPYIFILVLILSFAVPGVIQAFCAEDRKGGDIFNACIGAGSVIFGLFLSIFYCMFNTTVFSVNVWRGEFLITNDFAARIFLPSTVKRLDSIACDPRLPNGLVAKSKNCAVRSHRNGWLRIGREIKFKDMENHGYHIIQKKGLVIDLIECRVLVCVKIKDTKIVHLVRCRDEQNYLLEHVDFFLGNELFGGLDKNR